MRRENEFRYTKLAGILREQIISGYIKPGQFLLSENELCRHYALSRTSVRKSLDQLQKEGLIVKKVGQGTFVTPDLVIEETKNKVLRILAASPSHFMDICMPLIIEEFQSRHPNVEIKCLSFPTVDFWESFRASQELGLQADIVFVGDRQFSEVGDGSAFLELSRTMKDITPALYPKLRNTFSPGEAMRAVPITFSTVYLAYNPQLFERYDVPLPKADWTKEDFLRAAQRLTLDTDGDGIIDQYGLALSSAVNRWPLFALQNGWRVSDGDQKQALVRTLTLFHDLLYRYRVANLSPRYQVNSDAFIREKAAMVLTTSIEMAGWRHDRMSFEPQVAPMPFGDHPATLLIANALMLPATCHDEELAVRFLQTALSPEIQEKLSREKGFLAVLKSVNEKLWDRTTLESIHVVNDRIENSFFLHELFEDLSAIEEIEYEMELYWGGMESAAHFAERLMHLIGNQQKL